MSDAFGLEQQHFFPWVALLGPAFVIASTLMSLASMG